MQTGILVIPDAYVAHLIYSIEHESCNDCVGSAFAQFTRADLWVLIVYGIQDCRALYSWLIPVLICMLTSTCAATWPQPHSVLCL